MEKGKENENEGALDNDEYMEMVEIVIVEELEVDEEGQEFYWVEGYGSGVGLKGRGGDVEAEIRVGRCEGCEGRKRKWERV